MTVSLSGAAVAAPSAVAGTILRATSGFYSVLTDDGRLLQAQLRGLLKKERQATDLAVIGDRVRVSLADASHPMIDQVEPRRTKFSRRQPGPRGTWKEDMLVANVDQVLVVFACADPMPHLRMLDRFLVVAEHNEVPAVVVANKVDLVGLDRARELFSVYERIGYPVHYVSAREGIGVEELADQLAGGTSVVTGPSGVGKSTLLNAIQPGLRIETGEVSEVLHKGRHTTTSAELHALHGRRLRGRHAGAARARAMAGAAQRAGLVLPGVRAVPGRLRLQRLPPPGGAALRRAGGGGGRADLGRSPRLVPAAAAQRGLSGAAVSSPPVVELAPGLHAVSLLSSRGFLITEPELTLIDAGLPGSRRPLERYLARIGRSMSELRRIVCTHGHPDHIGGVREMTADTDAEVLMHPADIAGLNVTLREAWNARDRGKLIAWFTRGPHAATPAPRR